MNSSVISLPFWALVQVSHQESPPENVPCDSPESAVVFTTTGGVVAFMSGRKSGEWRVRLVADNNQLLVLLADLHSQDSPGVCVDPCPDGSSGTHYTLAEFGER
jgi:hypothetical protein